MSKRLWLAALAGVLSMASAAPIVRAAEVNDRPPRRESAREEERGKAQKDRPQNEERPRPNADRGEPRKEMERGEERGRGERPEPRRPQTEGRRPERGPESQARRPEAGPRDGQQPDLRKEVAELRQQLQRLQRAFAEMREQAGRGMGNRSMSDRQQQGPQRGSPSFGRPQGRPGMGRPQMGPPHRPQQGGDDRRGPQRQPSGRGEMRHTNTPSDSQNVD